MHALLTTAKLRTLLNDYLNDEAEGVAAGRNPISSINEALREFRSNQERAKVCLLRLLFMELRCDNSTASFPFR